MNEVLVTMLQLPHAVKGLVTPTPDGDYRVVLNSRLSAEEQRDVYDHELRHILENHFSRGDVPVQALENAAKQHGHLRAVIEKVQEQGLPMPQRQQRQRDAAPSVRPIPTGPSTAPLGAECPAPAPQTTHPPKTARPTPGALAAALLRARRAQLTGLWY